MFWQRLVAGQCLSLLHAAAAGSAMAMYELRACLVMCMGPVSASACIKVLACICSMRFGCKATLTASTVKITFLTGQHFQSCFSHALAVSKQLGLWT